VWREWKRSALEALRLQSLLRNTLLIHVLSGDRALRDLLRRGAQAPGALTLQRM
jgi:hypothetical protein